MKNQPNSIIDLKAKSLPPHASSETPAASGWERFWFTPTDPIALHALRFLAGLLFLSFLLPMMGHIDEFFSLNGWFDTRYFTEAGKLPLDRRPIFNWSLLYVFGASSAQAHALYWTTIGVLVLFTLGVAPRITSVLTWLLMMSYVSFGPLGFTEFDMLVIFAFYLMLGYLLLGQFSRPLSLVERILGPWDSFLPAFLFPSRSAKQAVYRSYSANLVMRLMQIHFAMIVVASCFAKLQVGDWWSGVALWYPLHPPFETTVDMFRKEAAHAPTLLFTYTLVQYLMLAWQITFPLWAWRPRFRIVLIGGGVLAFIGSIWIYQMPVLGPTLLLGCLLYLTPAEWRRVSERVQGVWQHFAGGVAEKRDEKVSVAV